MQDTFVDNSSTYTNCSSELAQLVARVKALRLAQQVDDILGTPMPRAVYNAETRRYSRGASPCEDRRQPVLSTTAEHWTYDGTPIEDPKLDSHRGKLLQDYDLDDFKQCPDTPPTMHVLLPTVDTLQRDSSTAPLAGDSRQCEDTLEITGTHSGQSISPSQGILSSPLKSCIRHPQTHTHRFRLD